MLERIATIFTGILFLVGLFGGLIIAIIDGIAEFFTGNSLTGIDPMYSILVVVLVPPVALILIYLGEWLDRLFKTK
jgi:Co/Zn/Cd efflux system component